MSFSNLEARLNGSVMTHLANAMATINGRSVPVVYTAAYKQSMVGVVGMGASEPQMVISNADVPPGFVGMEIEVDGAPWRVADRHPDGKLPTGLTLVMLEHV